MIQILFIERLIFRNWLIVILPQLLKMRNGEFQCLYLDASPSGLAAARITCKLLRIQVVQIKHRLLDVRDEEGNNILRFGLPHGDLMLLCAEIMKDPVIQEAIAAEPEGSKGYLKTYLMKTLHGNEPDNIQTNTLWKPAALIQLFVWWIKQAPNRSAYALVMTDNAFFSYLEKYGKGYGIRLIRGIEPWILREKIPVPLKLFLKRLGTRVHKRKKDD